MQRVPKVLVENQQLPNAYPAATTAAAQYAPAANTYGTISSATLNNTTATPQTVSVSIVPAGGAQAAANEVVTTMSVPAAGSAPTTVPALVGQTLAPGEMLLIKASLAASITVRISGYETTL